MAVDRTGPSSKYSVYLSGKLYNYSYKGELEANVDKGDQTVKKSRERIIYFYSEPLPLIQGSRSEGLS